MSVFLLSEKTVEEAYLSHSLSEDSLKLPISQTVVIGENEINKKKKKSLPEMIPAFGLWMSAISVFCFSAASVIVKLLTEFHSLQLLTIRCSFQLVFYLIITLIGQYPFFGVSGHRLSLLLRGIFGTVSATCIFMAFRMIPLSDASTLHFSAPVFVTILAFFLLKERLTILQIVTALVTFVGVVIIAKPEFIFNPNTEDISGQRMTGIVLAITAAFTTALVLISLRKLKTTPVSVVIMWYSVINVSSVLTYLIIDNQLVMPSGWYQYLLLIALGICGISDQFFMTLALRYESAGPVSVARTLNIVLAFIWDVTLFSQPLDWTSILGAILVAGCVIVLGVFKWKQEKPEQFDRIKKKISCNNKTDENDKLISRKYSEPYYDSIDSRFEPKVNGKNGRPVYILGRKVASLNSILPSRK